MLRHNGKLYIGSNGSLRNQILQELHQNGLGGHSGRMGTTKRMEQFFFWPSLKKDVIKYVKSCLVCQRSKVEHVHCLGLLQPLPIPQQPWTDISMDFIEGLPYSDHKSTIFVVIDRFTKFGHFLPLIHPYSTKDIATVFFEQIHKLHGLLITIVSDRDVIVMSAFWCQLFKLLGPQLHHSSAYHPQTDGQMERLNQCIENYLRCMIADKPK